MKLHRMIEMHSKYDNMHINGMFYALFCINNHVLSCYDCMLSLRQEMTGVELGEISVHGMRGSSAQTSCLE